MRNQKLLSRMIQIAVAAVIALGASPSAHGQQLQYFKDCVVGKRVSTNKDGRKGTITRLDTAWSYCYVRFDDDGKEVSFLYSLLNAEGGLDPKDRKLATGVYECVSYGQGSREKSDAPNVNAGGAPVNVGNMRITGPDTYSFGNGSGKFHVEASGKIVFETGPFSKYFSKLVSGGRVALNTQGENYFYPTTCELNRTLK